ncbi:MAG: vanadium nitrogenase [Lachnospiraceae bacterium]|jgi:hypothetical protein|nr:vanadium nitrogenase [Lachnospiraceae bacterium]
MGFLNGLFNYTIIFVVMIVLIVAAVFLGKFLRDKKDQKNS